MLNKVELRVIDRNFNLLGQISNYQSLVIERCFRTIGKATIVINRHLVDNDIIKRRNIVYVHKQPHKAFIIRHIEDMYEGSKISENVSIVAEDLKSLLTQRLTMPDTNKSHQVFTGTASFVLNSLVDKNTVNPVDPKRKINRLAIVSSSVGGNHRLESRFRNVSDEITNFCEQLKIGYHVGLNLADKTFDFSVKTGIDRTFDNLANEPVVFSKELDTLASIAVTDSELNYKNVAIVAGQGEGTERVTTIVNDEPEDLDRFEVFVDARDVANETGDGDDAQPRPQHEIIADLQQRGQGKLNELVYELFVEGDAIFTTQEEVITFSESINVPALNMATVYQGKRNFVLGWQPTTEDVYKVEPAIQSFRLDIPSKLTHVDRLSIAVNGRGIENVSLKVIVNEVEYPIVAGEIIFNNTAINKKITLIATLTSDDITPIDISFAGQLHGSIKRSFFGLNGKEYEKDFDLGDFVTVMDKQRQLRHDMQIIKLVEVYEPGKLELQLSFDKDRPTLIDKIKSEFKDLQVITKE